MGRTSTTLRPLRLPNFTAPRCRANSVSSPPLPTFSPGWNRVPRWRTMIEPASMTVPSNTFTPRRWAAESRPFLVEPAPFVFDMSALALRDPGDLDAVVVLAMAEPTPRVRLVLVGHPVDLRARGRTDDPGGD